MYGMDDLDALEDEAFDQDLLGEYTGAGVIFGATGGVMEAALRTAANILDGTNEKIDFMDVRGIPGIKEATYRIAGSEVDVKLRST